MSDQEQSVVDSRVPDAQDLPPFRPVRSRIRTALTGGRRIGTKLFDSAEHWSIVDGMLLPMADGRLANATSHLFRMDNGMTLTFGQIIALAGDFYALYKAPISDQPDMEKAFIETFNALNLNHDRYETEKILSIMEEEFAAIEAAILAGESPHEAYAHRSEEWDTAYNIATGGGVHYYTKIGDWGRYLWIAVTNWDHFGEHAHKVYRAGLQVAMKEAAAASAASGEQRDLKLQRAYALLAFACHYFTDSFSAGHMRTPRRHLHTFPRGLITTLSFVTDICAKNMHAEDNYNGLWVDNEAGDRWIAYGDGRYFDDANTANRHVMRAAVRAAIADVHAAFQQGAVLSSPKSPTFLPRVAGSQDKSNYSPLFVLDNDTVLVRKPISKLDAYEWIPVPDTHPWLPAFEAWQIVALETSFPPPETRVGAPPLVANASGPNVDGTGLVSTWLSPVPVKATPGVPLSTDATPALASYSGHLWACVKQGEQLLVGIHQGGRWSNFMPMAVPGLQIHATTGPCLVEQGGLLHCFFAETGGALRWLQCDGYVWQDNGIVEVDGRTVRTDATPTAVWLPSKQVLHVYHKGYAVDVLYFASWQRLRGWSDQPVNAAGQKYPAMTDDQPVAVGITSLNVHGFIHFRAHGGHAIYWVAIDEGASAIDFTGNQPVLLDDGASVETRQAVASAAQPGSADVLLVFPQGDDGQLQSLTQFMVPLTNMPRFEHLAPVVAADGTHIRSRLTPALTTHDDRFWLWTVQGDDGQIMESIGMFG